MTTSQTDIRKYEDELSVFASYGGLLRTATALRAGIHPRDLYEMRDKGVIERLDRGLYRVASAPSAGHPDLMRVGAKVPGGVLYLLSALAFHELTTQIPHAIHLAIPRSASKPRISWPPTRTYWVSEPAYSAAIEIHILDGIPVKVYSPEKTLADCFKHRNKIGIDVCLEALGKYKARGNANIDELYRQASCCRVTDVMKPYIEALWSVT